MTIFNFLQPLAERIKVRKRQFAVKLCEMLLSDVSLSLEEEERVTKSFAGQLSKIGWFRYNDHEYWYIEEGISLMQKAWALSKTPEVACRLGLMYERANRNAESTEVYREAFRLFPEDRQLRYQVSAHVLRHASQEDVRGFFAAVQELDPGDPFSAFVLDVLARFSEGVETLERSIPRTAGGRPSLILSFAVWGEEFIDAFMTHACSCVCRPAPKYTSS